MSRPVFVLDCSMTLSWFFEDEFTPQARRTRDLLAGGHAIAPAIWPSEVMNTLLMAERRNRLTADDLRAMLDLIAELPVKVEDAPPWSRSSEIVSIAREHRLSAHDAMYLDLARRHRVGLATLDKALRRSAAALGLPPVG